MVTANGHSELALHAYSAGLMSPRTNGPLLFIKEKSCASAESNGLNNFPSASTGIWSNNDGRLYLSIRPALDP